ncbi:hypothetical protein Q8A73_005288 [Channa argus]|nr:hypothetical protein Q8A73_005288 [Channa argus]
MPPDGCEQAEYPEQLSPAQQDLLKLLSKACAVTLELVQLKVQMLFSYKNSSSSGKTPEERQNDTDTLGNPASGDNPPVASATSVSDKWENDTAKTHMEHLPRRYNECPVGSWRFLAGCTVEQVKLMLKYTIPCSDACCFLRFNQSLAVTRGGTTRCVADTADEPMERRGRAARTGGLTLLRNDEDHTLLPAHGQGKCQC